MAGAIVKEIKALLKDEAVKYKIEREEELPIDENGNARLEYMTYLTINNVYEMLSQIGQNLGTILLEPEEKEKFIRAYIELDCWVVPNNIMVELIRLLNKIEEEEEELDMGDIDTTA